MISRGPRFQVNLQKIREERVEGNPISKYCKQNQLKEQDQDEVQSQLDIMIGQDTLRMNKSPSQEMTHRLTHKNSSFKLDENGETSDQLFFLANENQLQKEALQRATKIIQFLTEQNQCLSSQLTTLTKEHEKTLSELARLSELYSRQKQDFEETVRDLQEKSTKNQSLLYGSRTNGKVGKFTNIKVYNRYEEENYMAPLSQIEKQLIGRKIWEIEDELVAVEELCEEENEEIQQIKHNQKYLEAYIEDEVLSYKFLDQEIFRDQKPMRQVIHEYEKCIKGWQRYATALQSQLRQCLQGIQTWSQLSQKSLNCQVDASSVVSYIVKVLMRMMQREKKKITGENEELRKIVEQLISKMKPKPTFHKSSTSL